MEFLPANKQTEAYFTEFFKEKGLSEIVTFWKQQVGTVNVLALPLVSPEGFHPKARSVRPERPCQLTGHRQLLLAGVHWDIPVPSLSVDGTRAAINC